MAEQEARVAAVAAAGVEDVLAAADVEAAGADEPAGQGLVAGQHAGDGGQRPRQPVVVVADEAAVLGERPASVSWPVTKPVKPVSLPARPS